MRASGWQCPVCGYIWGPFHPGCNNCNRPDHEKSITTTSTTILKEPLTTITYSGEGPNDDKRRKKK